ncbi:MAG: superoxide dismutase family protein [Thermoanaerobaculia bacterium]
MKNSRWMKSTAVATVALIAALGCAKKEEAAAPAPVKAAAPESMTAQATLRSRADMTVSGMLMFTQEGDVVSITAHIEGAPPGTHGLHIHDIGDCSSEDFKSAGGHFNPTEAPHGGPADAERHAGDLGNIEVGENGSAHLEMTSDMITVGAGANSVIGRGVILHEKADDLVSQPTGAAGSRLACAVVEAN